MSKMKNQTVKGFKDFQGKSTQKRVEIRKVLVETFETFGFEPAETPIVEYEEFVKSDNEKDEAVSDIFKLKDRGKRNLALRYEFTFQLKRLMKNQKLPYRRYQIGPVFRDEPVQKNRLRQFTQCDADIISSNTKEEAEILSLVKTIFEELNLKPEIYVNNRKLLNEILEKEKIKDKKQVIREIDKLDKLPESEVKKNLEKYNARAILKIFKKPESYFKKFASFKEIQELKKYCKLFNVKINFSSSLARGLSYYNGNIFEIKSKGMKESICAGGSYMFNNIQCTGVSFGLDRLATIVKLDEKKKKILVISINQDKEAIDLIKKLRENKISCMGFFGKTGKALEYANSKGFDYVVFVGEKEIKSRKFTLRDMGTGKERKVSEKDLVKGFRTSEKFK